jgi:hypothetical protein
MSCKLTSVPTTLDDHIENGNILTASRTRIESNQIRPATLIYLHKLGFKVVPLSIDNEAVIPWTPVYEDPNFWSLENIVGESPKFKNVATVFGRTHIKDENGLELNPNVFDGDSKYVYQIINSATIQDPIIKAKVQHLITKSSSESLFDFLIKSTVVIKTKKEFGYHFYWFSHKQNPRIRTQDCIPGYEFEIKTDKGSGHNTLPPSAHRNDPNFRYSHVGRRDKIAIVDELYDILTELLSEYLTEKNKTSYGSSKKLRTIDNLCRSKKKNITAIF